MKKSSFLWVIFVLATTNCLQGGGDNDSSSSSDSYEKPSSESSEKDFKAVFKETSSKHTLKYLVPDDDDYTFYSQPQPEESSTNSSSVDDLYRTENDPLLPSPKLPRSPSDITFFSFEKPVQVVCAHAKRMPPLSSYKRLKAEKEPLERLTTPGEQPKRQRSMILILPHEGTK